jgi:hypothetical protein
MYRNYREGCTFSNSNTVTCSLTITVSETVEVDENNKTTSYTTTSSGVNASPTNAPLYYPVTITAGVEKVDSSQATVTPTSAVTGTSSRTSSGAKQAAVKGKWALLSALFINVYFVVGMSVW